MVGVAVKVAEAPAQIEVVGVEILTEGVTVTGIVIVIILETAVLVNRQFPPEILMLQETVLPLAKAEVA